MRIVVLQHGPWGGPGVVGEQLQARGFELDVRHTYAGDAVPGEPPDALVVMGGQMSTDEKDAHPFLQRESDLLARCVQHDTPALGICLGAQLLAEVTGGTVRHDVPEIGFTSVRLTDAGRADPVMGGFDDGFETFNAHRDFITAGEGAVVLATSDQAPVHALRAGARVYGVQFHPEMDAARVARYANADQPGAYLRHHGWEPKDLIALAEQHDEKHARMGRALTDRWIDAVLAPVAH